VLFSLLGWSFCWVIARVAHVTHEVLATGFGIALQWFFTMELFSGLAEDLCLFQFTCRIGMQTVFFIPYAVQGLPFFGVELTLVALGWKLLWVYIYF